MLNRLPSPVQCPPLSQLLSDLCDPTPRQLARALGVSAGTVSRWIRQDDAPRPVLLALFWLTRWGVSRIDAEAHNSAAMHAAIAASLRTEAERLRRELARVVAAADFGCANDYTAEPLPVGRAVVVPIRSRRVG
ncbi:hypothetical protein [Roseateles violae]|uniref:Uncharacterized protein n=1 Tax=Roseateles violae TaxID=3058042 RepID=A0ABT8E0J6_9BURK|nr:hypothetical protein [Pelomonas sp. PFR6]MDN3923324.1 hypothetical protein [Pelomonas sp. PFR6]